MNIEWKIIVIGFAFAMYAGLGCSEVDCKSSVLELVDSNNVSTFVQAEDYHIFNSPRCMIQFSKNVFCGKQRKIKKLIFCRNDSIKIARSWPIFNSEVPTNADYIFPIDSAGNIVFMGEGLIGLHSISKHL